MTDKASFNNIYTNYLSTMVTILKSHITAQMYSRSSTHPAWALYKQILTVGHRAKAELALAIDVLGLRQQRFILLSQSMATGTF